MTMPNPDYSALVVRQRQYFLSGCTRPASNAYTRRLHRLLDLSRHRHRRNRSHSGAPHDLTERSASIGKENIMPLKNKVAIVTGGNSGIGQAIVLELARQDASIVIDYLVHPEATEARRSSSRSPSSVTCPSALRPM
jgi:hypothetical protein